MKTNYLLVTLMVIAGVGLSLILTFSVVNAFTPNTKQQEVTLKQNFKPEANLGQRSVDAVGIFAPGFTNEAEMAAVNYQEVYGSGNVQLLDYKGFTLVIPPTKSLADVALAKSEVDMQITANENKIPSAETQEKQIEKIRSVFDVVGLISFDSFLGAYTDEYGFQYNFWEDELINKQIGATSTLASRFANKHPHLIENRRVGALMSIQEIRRRADLVIRQLFPSSKAVELSQKVAISQIDALRIGLTYGDNEVQVLFDTFTGTIIHYSKNK